MRLLARGARSLSVAIGLAAVLSMGGVARAAARGARVVVFDDGEKVKRDRARRLDESPWPAGPIDLFALRGETLALQVVIEAGDARVDDARVLLEPFVAQGTGRAPLQVDVERFVERFITVERPTGNDDSADTLAFMEKSAPGPRFLGAIADPLVPASLEVARVRPHERAAIWVDLTVPENAAPGLYRSQLLVRDDDGELEARAVELRVIGKKLPFAAAPSFVYYDTAELVRRMGDAGAELDLRQLLHAHHMEAIHEVKKVGGERELELDRSAISGAAYTRDRGYQGPGQGIGEGILALGAYGSFGAPGESARDTAAALMARLVAPRDAATTAAFVYAIDETCGSDWPAQWRTLLRRSPDLRGVRVGATCGAAEPWAQAADLVMQTGPDFDPARARFAEDGGGEGEGQRKWVWAYNGVRPAAGPMMLDVPATDLRANSWIALRYGVQRWFYWGATFWFDDNRGGRGGPTGFDPYVIAETFHNRDGDHANGDGILVYPGHQVAPGMVDYGVARVFPSVRLKNLRRGIEDAGYVALARAADPTRTEAVVRRMIPRALAWAGNRPSWPQHARPWLEARRELADILLTAESSDPSSESFAGDAGEVVSESCSIANTRRVPSALPWGALLFVGGMGFASRRFSRAKPSTSSEMATTRKREEQPPSTKPEGHRSSNARVATAAKVDPDAAKRSEAPTLVPPPIKPSGIRAKRRSVPAASPSATIDEVVADLTNDPRREDDD